MQSRLRDNLLHVRIVIALCFVPTPSIAQDYTEQYLNGLRQRRLFVLAEKYCEDELAEEKQSARRATLVSELSLTLVEHGKLLAAKERDAMWKQAEQVLFEGSGKIPEPELKTRLEAQGAVNQAHQATFVSLIHI